MHCLYCACCLVTSFNFIYFNFYEFYKKIFKINFLLTLIIVFNFVDSVGRYYNSKINSEKNQNFLFNKKFLQLGKLILLAIKII